MTTLTDSEYELVAELIKDHLGVVLDESNKPYFARRMQAILYNDGFSHFGEYYQLILGDSNGQILTKLVDQLSPLHSYFNREREHFDLFYRAILPEMAELVRYRGPQKLRIWTAGCSTGEEPYLMAMLLTEYFHKDLDAWDISILATDVSQEVLNAAKTGIFSKQNTANLSSHLQEQYFTRVTGSHFIINPILKELIRFRCLDLMDDELPFDGRFQVIFCRNVLSLFDEPTRRAIIRRFYRHTMPGGYLLVGMSESINQDDTKYRYVQQGVYRNESSSL